MDQFGIAHVCQIAQVVPGRGQLASEPIDVDKSANDAGTRKNMQRQQQTNGKTNAHSLERRELRNLRRQRARD